MANPIIYREDNKNEFGVEHGWVNAKILDTVRTRCGTLIEMVERPRWGVACYMNNSIQSCQVDEKYYHEALVHPVMTSVKSPKRVCIVGGGEGATAREVFKFPGVEVVDMYEWDEDVVRLFKEKYPQWAQGAWDDSRLRIHYDDIFEAIKPAPAEKYDVIIVDLFEPCEENRQLWVELLHHLNSWVKNDGSIAIYAGMRNILAEKQPYQYLVDILTESDMWRGIEVLKLHIDKDITPYRMWIPSFSGESTFLLLTPPSVNVDFTKRRVASHITEPIWNSYKTLNWK